VPFLDSIQCFLRRYWNGYRRQGPGRWRRALAATAVADRGHVHHRLLQLGFSHAQVARVLVAVTAVSGLLSLLLLVDASLWPALGVTSIVSAYCLGRLALLRGSVEAEPTTHLAGAVPGSRSGHDKVVEIPRAVPAPRPAPAPTPAPAATTHTNTSSRTEAVGGSV
jgi:hypothetical protein